jgi:hypothetical protein
VHSYVAKAKIDSLEPEALADMVQRCIEASR